MFGIKGQSGSYPIVAKKHVGDYKMLGGKGIHQIPFHNKTNLLGVVHDEVKKVNSLEKSK